MAKQGKHNKGKSNDGCYNPASLDSLLSSIADMADLSWFGDARSSSAQANAARSKAHGDFYQEAMRRSETAEERASIRHDYSREQALEREYQKDNDDGDLLVTVAVIATMGLAGYAAYNKFLK